MTIIKKLSFLTKRRDMDMTEGSIFGNLVSFALPLLVGNLFQQLYNMVDTWVIGQSGNDPAYAAVGSIAPIINIFIGFFTGLSTGAGVVISQYFGAKDEKGVRESVHTSVTLTLILTVVFTVAGILLTPLMLELLLHGESPLIYKEAYDYLTIYFAGIASLLLYNIGAGILRAVGDSQRPFYFLVVSAVINIGLDFLFVFGFGMAAAGVAIATVIAQTVSAVLAIGTLLHTNSWVKIKFKELRINFAILKRIIKVGIPAALQMALTAFSNVFVQGYIGSTSGESTLNLGAWAGYSSINEALHAGEEDIVRTINLGAWASYSKIDQLMFLPMQTLMLTITTFVGQNLGKGDIKRAKKGTYIAYAMATVTTVFFMIPILIFAPTVASWFNSTPEIVERAAMLLRCLSPFYVFCCVNQVFSGSLRGTGNSTAPMLIMLGAFVGFRQLYLFGMSTFISNELLPVGLAYPAGWMLCAVTMFTYYKLYMKKFEKKKAAGLLK